LGHERMGFGPTRQGLPACPSSLQKRAREAVSVIEENETEPVWSSSSVSRPLMFFSEFSGSSSSSDLVATTSHHLFGLTSPIIAAKGRCVTFIL
jgi:hypothetical protein